MTIRFQATHKTVQEVEPAIVKAIAEEFAEWCDTQGYQLTWARNEPEPTELDEGASYADLAARFTLAAARRSEDR